LDGFFGTIFENRERICDLELRKSETLFRKSIEISDIGGNVGRIRALRRAYKILVGKPQEMNPLERSRSRPIWEDTIKMDLRYGVR
jgi:hypothetical protein